MDDVQEERMASRHNSILSRKESFWNLETFHYLDRPVK
jgi:hypothetical protein